MRERYSFNKYHPVAILKVAGAKFVLESKVRNCTFKKMSNAAVCLHINQSRHRFS